MRTRRKNAPSTANEPPAESVILFLPHPRGGKVAPVHPELAPRDVLSALLETIEFETLPTLSSEGFLTMAARFAAAFLEGRDPEEVIKDSELGMIRQALEQPGPESGAIVLRAISEYLERGNPLPPHFAEYLRDAIGTVLEGEEPGRAFNMKRRKGRRETTPRQRFKVRFQVQGLIDSEGLSERQAVFKVARMNHLSPERVYQLIQAPPHNPLR